MQESPPQKRFFVHRMHAAQPSCDSPNTSRSFALGARSAWSVKTRPAPSRHCRDARVYSHTTTAIHDISTPTSPPSKGTRQRTTHSEKGPHETQTRRVEFLYYAKQNYVYFSKNVRFGFSKTPSCLNVLERGVWYRFFFRIPLPLLLYG